MKIKRDNIKEILLVGGGSLLFDLCDWSLSNSYPVKVITSSRHSKEIINGKSLKKFLDEKKVLYCVTDDISSKDVSSFVGNTDETFCLSLGAAWIFSEGIIKNLFQNHLYNIHGTRLPQNRGGASISWQILLGSRFGFCQLHMIDGGIDTGNIIKSQEFLYPRLLPKPLGLYHAR